MEKMERLPDPLPPPQTRTLFPLSLRVRQTDPSLRGVDVTLAGWRHAISAHDHVLGLVAFGLESSRRAKSVKMYHPLRE